VSLFDAAAAAVVAQVIDLIVSHSTPPKPHPALFALSGLCARVSACARVNEESFSVLRLSFLAP